jgi:23S rRNA (adenine-N6)-dimethyltransferase
VYKQKRRRLYSQNFLRSPKLVIKLVRLSSIGKNDLIVEIGPGKGIITRQLTDVAREVIAVEVDPKLAKRLKSQFKNSENVAIVEKDFFDWHLPKETYKVFSNIPFNMTADIVRTLTESPNPPEISYLIMQDKAFARFAGKPNESQSSLLLKPWFEFRSVTEIDRSEYTPEPSVDTLLAEIRKRMKPYVDPQARQSYRDFIIYGFEQWEPTVFDAYDAIFTYRQKKIIDGRSKIKGKKPSKLTIDQWLDLYKTYKRYVSDKKKRVIRGAEKRSEKRSEKRHKKHEKWHRTR